MTTGSPNENSFSLNSIYGYLQPKSTEAARSDIQPVDFLQAIMQNILDTEGTFKTFPAIKRNLDAAFKESQDGTGEIFHAIYSNNSLSTTDYLYIKSKGEDAYWKVNDKLVTLKGELISPNSFTATSTAKPVVDTAACAAFVTRGPYINPSRRNTDIIELFLNYIPTHVASQMQPYLELEFELPRYRYGTEQEETTFYTSTPSLLRFLMGSGAVTGPGALKLSDADVAMESATIMGSGPQANVKPWSTFVGMELFLMPQSLTNMDTLKATASTKESAITRIVDAKPFTPFMSIEGVTITSVNAGAGAMVHKKASLKLKIHDKSRLPEIAEFIRGPSGYSRATIWMTYGWIAPRSQERDDEYAKFINKHFLAKNAWQVMNAQYSFDNSGQVSLSIELVSKGVASLQTINVNVPTQAKTMSRLNEILEVLQEITKKLTSTDASGTEIRIPQVLSAGLEGNTNAKNATIEIAALKKALEKSGKLTPTELDKLTGALTELEGNVDPEAKKINAFETALQTEAKDAILAIIEKCKDGIDPFLPQESNKNFFKNYDKLRKAISLFETPPTITPKEGEKGTANPAEPPNYVVIKPSIRYISFGKLFMNAIVPSILEAGIANEVQVFFYALNDECGPISGCSIAEFPIDTERLSYAFSNFVRLKKSYEIKIEEFMSLIIQTQFNNTSAIGYGASHLYEYHPEGGEEKANEKIDGYADLLAEWQYSDPPFKTRPSIEMKIETGKVGPSGGVIDEINQSMKAIKWAQQQVPPNGSFKDDLSENGKVVARIHIYDKQNKPYKNLQQVINTESGFIDVGKFADDGVQRKLSDWWSKLNKETQTKILGANVDDFMKAYKEGAGEDLRIVTTATGINTPGIGKDRKSIINAISRFVPTITIGTNGTMISQATIASKTDNLASAANLINQSKKIQEGANPAGPPNAIQGPDGIPIRTFPGQLTMTSRGCTPAELYQQYFIDFGTGTSLDNLYNCSQIVHNIGPGKFETQWTFIFTDGYGQLAGAPTAAIASRGIASKFMASARDAMEQANPKPEEKK